MVSLRPITDANREAVEALRLAPGQERYVSDVVDSLLEAIEQPAGRALLIDHRHQRRGYGTATLDLIVEYFRARPGVAVLSTSAGQGEGSPIAFYERYGFERTGVIVFGNEVLLQLRIR